QAVPGVADGHLRPLPRQAGPAVLAVPVAAEGGLHLVEVFARVALPRLPAVAIRRGELHVIRALGVGARLVILAPVGVLSGGVDRLGDALAGVAPGHRANDRADDRADGPGHRADGGPSRAGARCANAGAD